MLSTAEVAQLIQDHVTYRPGWRFEIYQGRWEGNHVIIWATVEDSTHPGETLDIPFPTFMPPMRDTRDLQDWLGYRLGRIETHEMREWLKWDGKPMFDPHAPGADRDR